MHPFVYCYFLSVRLVLSDLLEHLNCFVNVVLHFIQGRNNVDIFVILTQFTYNFDNIYTYYLSIDI